jgi:hypothetical protein
VTVQRVDVNELDREFKPLVEHGHCLVTVSAEADRKKGAERRVFSLRFGD